MRLFKALTFSLFLLFQSCDLADQKEEPKESNQSKAEGPVENKSEEIAQPESSKMRDPQPTPPKPKMVEPEIIEPENHLCQNLKKQHLLQSFWLQLKIGP